MRRRSRKLSPQTRQHCCFSGCTGALIIFGGIAILLLSEPPRPDRLNYTPTQIQEAQERAAELRSSFKVLAKDLKSGAVHSFKIEIGEPELNELLLTDEDAARALGQLDLKNPWVLIEPGRVKISVTRSVASMDVTSTVDLVPRLFGERVEVFVDSSRTGLVRMPDAVTRRFGARLSAKIKEKITQEKLKVKALKVERGRIFVEGTTG